MGIKPIVLSGYTGRGLTKTLGFALCQETSIKSVIDITNISQILQEIQIWE
jgi:hypothetical protein